MRHVYNLLHLHTLWVYNIVNPTIFQSLEVVIRAKETTSSEVTEKCMYPSVFDG